MPSEFQFDNDNISGEGSVQVLDSDQHNPTTILDRNKPFDIEVEWKLRGTGVQTLGGEWTLTAYLEGMGPIDEVIAATRANIPENGGINRSDHEELLTVPERTVTTDGVYKLVVAMTHQNGVAGALFNTSMAGYVEYEEFLQFISPA